MMQNFFQRGLGISAIHDRHDGGDHRQAEAKGLGVVSLGTRMVDPPVVLRAQRLVDQARRAGVIGADRAGAGITVGERR